MAIDALTETTTAIIAALFGGAGVKILDKVLSNRSQYLQETERLRTELRQDVERLSEELVAQKEEADEWRKKYWELVESTVQLKASNTVAHQAIDSMKEEINTLVFQIETLKSELSGIEVRQALSDL